MYRLFKVVTPGREDLIAESVMHSLHRFVKRPSHLPHFVLGIDIELPGEISCRYFGASLYFLSASACSMRMPLFSIWMMPFSCRARSVRDRVSGVI